MDSGEKAVNTVFVRPTKQSEVGYWSEISCHYWLFIYHNIMVAQITISVSFFVTNEETIHGELR